MGQQVTMFSESAEMSVLGGLLSDECPIERCKGLEGKHFHSVDNQNLFEAIKSVKESGVGVDGLVVADLMESRGQLTDGMNMLLIMELNLEFHPTANIQSYANIVIDHYNRRQIYRLGSMMQSGAAMGKSPLELLEMAQGELSDFGSIKRDERKVTFTSKDVMLDLAAKIERQLNGTDAPGFMCGIKSIDERSGGYKPGDLIIVGGRPSMGKTSVGMNIVLNGCYSKKLPAVVFSAESPVEQLMRRAICSMGAIDMGRMKNSQLNEGEWASFGAVSANLANGKIIFDQANGSTAAEIRSRARKYVKDFGKPEVILIDHLKQIKRPGKNNMEQETGDIVREFKDMAVELEVPVILLAQLNRGLEQRTDKRPICADLRDSGQVEEVADVIHFVYRDEVYNKDTEAKGILEWITAKSRDGEIGTDRLLWRGQYNQIKELTAENMGY